MRWTFLLLLIGLLSCSSREDPFLENETDTFAGEMLTAVNSIRAKGCQCGDTYMPPAPPLRWSDQLAEAARRHARDMARNRHFDHTGTDGSSIGRRIADTGYRWKAVGENIALGYADISAVVAGWKNSQGHCRNFMDPAFSEMGAAKEGSYWVQTLASPSIQ